MDIELQDHRKATTSPREVTERDFLLSARAELSEYFAEMCKFSRMEPTEVFLHLSAFAARASEIRSILNDTDSRLCNSFRTKQIDPFLAAVELQFRLISRVASVREMEFKLSGATT